MMPRVWIAGTKVRLDDSALAAARTRAEVQERLAAAELQRQRAVARARALQRACGSKGRPGEGCADPDACGCDDQVKPLDGDCYDDAAAENAAP